MSGVISLAFDDAEAFPGHVAAQDQAKDSFAYTKSPSWWLHLSSCPDFRGRLCYFTRRSSRLKYLRAAFTKR
jgi:hypothetical protein